MKEDALDKGFHIYVLKNDKEKIEINVDDMDKYYDSMSYRFVIEK
jgi:hypothetical protein